MGYYGPKWVIVFVCLDVTINVSWCPIQHCKAEYIGYTECTLSRRMIAHSYNGSILKHFKNQHDLKPNKQLLIDNSSILVKGPNKNNLLIKEVLLIQAHHPQINRQYDTFPNILKLQVYNFRQFLTDQQTSNGSRFKRVHSYVSITLILYRSDED